MLAADIVILDHDRLGRELMDAQVGRVEGAGANLERPDRERQLAPVGGPQDERVDR